MLSFGLRDTSAHLLTECQILDTTICHPAKQWKGFTKQIRAKQTGARRPISLSQFRRMWKNLFTKVVIPKVGIRYYYT
jgi:hypothetical protein